jgi:hypothetical protein
MARVEARKWLKENPNRRIEGSATRIEDADIVPTLYRKGAILVEVDTRAVMSYSETEITAPEIVVTLPSEFSRRREDVLFYICALLPEKVRRRGNTFRVIFTQY